MSNKNKFILAMLRAFFSLFSPEQKKRIIGLLVSILQESVPSDQPFTPAAADDSLANSIGAFPQQLQQFETLYDPHTGGWNVPSPLVEISQYDPRLYPAISYDSVELEVGQFYYAFVKMVRPTHILETGVARGYSTSCLASALAKNGSSGHIFAIDPAQNPHLWDNTPLEKYVTWIPKRSQDALSDVNHCEYDLLVIDSNHDYDTCLWEVMHFEKLLKPGGFLLMHDSLYFDGVGAVVKQLMLNPRFDVVTLPTPRTHGNPRSRCPGVTVVRKISNGEPLVEYETQHQGWFVGDPTTSPFLETDSSLSDVDNS